MPGGRMPGVLARILVGRGMRSFADGFVALLLPIHLSRLGYGPAEVGLVATATLLGSAALTLGLGFAGHRVPLGRALAGAALLMAATGAGFAGIEAFWPLLLVAFVGTINPSSGDVSVFLPLEHTLIAHLVDDAERTAVFARYSLIGSVGSALGALSIGTLHWFDQAVPEGAATQVLFALYGVLGLATLLLYAGMPDVAPAAEHRRTASLGPSRRRVWGLAALFSVDSFGGGFVVNSLLALWLFQRFGLSAAATGTIFFVTGLCSAVSYLVAVRLARRIGLVNTMVFTHLPANILLILAAFAPTLPVAVVFLVLRSLLSQMDVPARTSYVMAIVEPAERPAAASLTAVPRSLASALSPALAGAMLGAGTFGWPLVCAGALKIAYDLTLLACFRAVKPPEERTPPEASD
ncbi:MFS transporter [Skermanella sp. TT6]|uniref:MFS transporter n=1 Tax=Skermanella cutis TaxID=2775420 RepID=A0ABX7B695_9PROT|nr:MFS transporter [Skermanella sp. TT6]QQP89300.1 MFS transporter [Skermanella sp. TT6]